MLPLRTFVTRGDAAKAPKCLVRKLLPYDVHWELRMVDGRIGVSDDLCETFMRLKRGMKKSRYVCPQGWLSLGWAGLLSSD